MGSEPDEIPPDESAQSPAEEEVYSTGGEQAAPEEETAPGQQPEHVEEPLLEPCVNCATLLDVGDLEPFAKVHCPICGTAMRARTRLKNFTLVEVLGAGGMGAVYKALDTNLDRMVALKVVRKEFSADAEYLAKFVREARITASVNHPHVVKVYSFGSDHGLFYIAMELVDKGSLDDLTNLQGRVAEIQALGVGIQVAQGLQAAHQKGLIHRDVKPGNILFADAQTAKIVDFGLALLAEHEAEERGEVWGTPYYVAPEKLDHQPEDFRSDMYSLGGTLFHAIAGRPPFEADTASMVALKHLKSKVVSLQAFAPDVSSATAYVINRTLNKDPDQRYQSYAEMIEHLEYARAQLSAAAAGPRRPKQRVVVESALQKNASAIISLVLILLLIAAGAAIYIYRDQIFPQPKTTLAESGEDSDVAARRMHDQFDAARKQIVAGDYDGAADALKRLNDENDLPQPFQNWVTVNQGLISLLQENTQDAGDWFKVVKERSHFSNDPSDTEMVDFFSKVSDAMSGGDSISAAQGAGYALDSAEALAPMLFGLKDWSLGKFSDAGALFALYLNSTPKDPFQWVGDYKPLIQKYAGEEAAYEKVAAAAAAANTPDQRADALKQVDALKAQVTGKLAARLDAIERDLKAKSAALDAPYYEHIAEVGRQDQAVLLDAKQKYDADCADMRFDDAWKAVNAAVVSGTQGILERQALLKKAGWLREFKAQLIIDINQYGYAAPIINRSGGRLPDGQKKAGDAGLIIQTPFGVVPTEWKMIPVGTILAIANQYMQKMAATAPQQAADREWLSGVFACEEGMPRDGHNLLVQASQAKSEYKDELGLFLESE
ncbi:MAG: serine/threonine-protein kinase [Chthoniobacteraceae bacterium]|jgi:serine/threonine protein kinase